MLMHPLRPLSLLAHALAATFVVPSLVSQETRPAPAAVKVEPIAAPLRAELPELFEQSVWAFDGNANTPQRDRGAYPIGNGKVFGCLGLGPRANTIACVSGPKYQTEETFTSQGNFGAVTLELRAGNEPVALDRQRVRRVRGTGLVVTEDASASGDVRLRTLAFATPGREQLTSVVEIEAPAGKRLTLRLRCDGGRAEGNTLRQTSGRGPNACGSVLALTGARAEGSELAVDLEQGKWTGVLVIATHAGATAPAGFQPSPPTLEAALGDARATLLSWKENAAAAFHVDTDHRKIADLVEDARPILLAQRCAQSGLVVPMLNHRVARPRDQNGPLVAFLRLNLWSDAKRILEYWYNATLLLGRVPTEARLDLDFAPLASAKPDWSAITVPAGDAALWILLQHFWYWRVTQDVELIQKHWPLIEVCIKRLPKGKDDLIPFTGDEPYLEGALGRLFPEPLDETALLIAHGKEQDHEAYSLTNGVLFLLAIQAVGEMVDGIDKKVNPAKYPGGEMPAERLSRPYTERSFAQMDKVEKRFWQAGRELFAPAVSPLTDAQHQAPFANANLSLLWAGWTFPTGERSRDNLRNSLKELWLRGTRIGSTPTCGYATGDLQAMLVVALCERDAVERLDALDELLKQAEPAGEWGELYDPDGRPVGARDQAHPCRAHPGMTGVGVDAVVFALNGMRYVSVPNWDNTDIRAELRMPHGATYVTMKDLRKDGRRLHVFMNEIHERLSKQELKENEQKKPEDRRRTDIAHRRLAFKMELASDNPARTYYDVGLNAMGTMFVRYLQKTTPETQKTLDQRIADWIKHATEHGQLDTVPLPQSPTAQRLKTWFTDNRDKIDALNENLPDDKKVGPPPGELHTIDEREFWTEDKEAFLPKAAPPDPAAAPKPWSSPVAQPGADLLFVGNRRSSAEFAAGEKTTIVDSGLPFTIAQLLPLLRKEDGALVHPTLYLDHGYDSVSPATRKTAKFWQDAAWQKALNEFRAAGGAIVTTQFFTKGTSGESAVAAKDGAFTVPGGSTLVIGFRTDQPREVVLRLGSSGPITAGLNGTELVKRTGARRPLPDADSQLATLKAGANTLTIQVGGEGPQTVFARASDARGLPVAGIAQD